MVLTLGIIGAGYIGTVHAKNLMADTRLQILGVVDVVPHKADELARLVKGRTFPSAETLLDAGVETVYVCTPNTLHTKAVVAALQRNVHVFSEKPMATTLHEAQQILEAAHTSRALYQIGHNRRFAPVYKFAKQKILEGFAPTSAHVKMNRGELKHPPWANMATASFTSVGNCPDSPQPILRPSPATGHDADMLDVEDPYLGYDAETWPYQQPQRTMRSTSRAGLLRG
jgi:predicted dehydrogenase